jgi:hypothetical protein
MASFCSACPHLFLSVAFPFGPFQKYQTFLTRFSLGKISGCRRRLAASRNSWYDYAEMAASEAEGSADGESSRFGYIPSYHLCKTSFSFVSMKFSQNFLIYRNLT